MQFPKDFLWGTATSSYQIEGAVNEDGKGKSIWDVFTRAPGAVKDRSSGDMAIDHYHRFREDIRLMAQMGIRNYRFSIAWGRILPDGTGKVNEKGLAFYSELVDCLLENGIRPFCTLYHWDLPYALHLRGGWLNPEMPEWFANYTRIVADALGDRVKDFITINEPQCIIGSGYALGVHAPGLKCCAADIVRAAHNLMLAHGRATQVLRAHVPGVRVGYAPCGDPCVPYTNSPEDMEAARKEYFTVHIDEKVGPAWNIAWFSDPVMLGQYPADGLVGYEQYLPDGWQEALKTIHQPLDFYGQNIYQGQWWRRGVDGKPWAGPSMRLDCTGGRASSMSATRRRFSSPRTAWMPTMRSVWTARCMTRIGRTICTAICTRWVRRRRTACRCWATSIGASLTISSGRMGIRSASGWSM